ncbi:hypothetical protein [Komagataeibacter xylinus]|uniref:hypothetical protein n=1 Tax=Komagataeibacter xylinus TaxID=28448 RepID=UPI00280BC78C|nr:hypothetical protein [Komagataeibacter xylinus]
MTAKTYAWIDPQGLVGQTITTDADLSTLYAPDFVAACVDVTSVTPQPAQHWTATKSTAGVWSFATPVAATVSLATQAKNALTAAASATWEAYGMYGETTPADVVTYLKALQAIANGTDTTSTALPAAPTDLNGTTTTTTGSTT